MVFFFAEREGCQEHRNKSCLFSLVAVGQTKRGRTETPTVADADVKVIKEFSTRRYLRTRGKVRSAVRRERELRASSAAVSVDAFSHQKHPCHPHRQLQTRRYHRISLFRGSSPRSQQRTRPHAAASVTQQETKPHPQFRSSQSSQSSQIKTTDGACSTLKPPVGSPSFV